MKDLSMFELNIDFYLDFTPRFNFAGLESCTPDAPSLDRTNYCKGASRICFADPVEENYHLRTKDEKYEDSDGFYKECIGGCIVPHRQFGGCKVFLCPTSSPPPPPPCGSSLRLGCGDLPIGDDGQLMSGASGAWPVR